MSHRPLIRLLGKTDLRLRFETRPVYRTFLTCACVCKYMHTQRTDFHSSSAVAFYLPHFLLCLLGGGFLRYPRSSSSSPIAPNPPFLRNRVQPRGWHTGPNQTVSSPLSAFLLEDRPMGLTGNRGGR